MGCKLTESEHNKFVSSLYWLVFRLSEDENQIINLPSNLTMPCEIVENSYFCIKPDVVEFLCSGYPYYYLCVILQTKVDPLVYFHVKNNLTCNKCFEKVFNYINGFRKVFIFDRDDSISIPSISELVTNEPFNYKAHIKLLDTIMVFFSNYYVNMSQVIIEAKKLCSNIMKSDIYFDTATNLELAFVFWLYSLQINMGINVSNLQMSKNRMLLDLISNGVSLSLIVVKYFPDLANDNNLNANDIALFANKICHLNENKKNEKRKYLLAQARKVLGESKTLLTILCLSIGDLMFPAESIKPNVMVVLCELFHAIIKKHQLLTKIEEPHANTLEQYPYTLNQISEDVDVLMTSDDISIDEMIKNMDKKNANDLFEDERIDPINIGHDVKLNESLMHNINNNPNSSIQFYKTNYAHDRLQSIYSRIANVKQKNSVLIQPNHATQHKTTNESINNHRSIYISDHFSPLVVNTDALNKDSIVESFKKDNIHSTMSNSSHTSPSYSPITPDNNSTISSKIDNPIVFTNTIQNNTSENCTSPFSVTRKSLNLRSVMSKNVSIQDFENTLNKSCEAPSIYRNEDSLTSDDAEENDNTINTSENDEELVKPGNDESLWFDQTKIAELEKSLHHTTKDINSESISKNMLDNRSIIDFFNSTDDELDVIMDKKDHTYIDNRINDNFNNESFDSVNITHNTIPSKILADNILVNTSCTTTLSSPIPLSNNPHISSPIYLNDKKNSCQMDFFIGENQTGEVIEKKRQLVMARLQKRNKSDNKKLPSIQNNPNLISKLNTTTQLRIKKNKLAVDQQCDNDDHITIEKSTLNNLKDKTNHHYNQKNILLSNYSAKANVALNSSKVPKLFAPMKMNSNRLLIHNAITNYCLAGDANRKNREKAIEQLSLCNGTHFLVHLKSTLQYRGLYVFCPNQNVATRIHGVGPRHLEQDSVDIVYRYHSDKKTFTIIPFSKALSISCDAFTIATIRKPISSSPNNLLDRNFDLSHTQR